MEKEAVHFMVRKKRGTKNIMSKRPLLFPSGSHPLKLPGPPKIVLAAGDQVLST